MAKVQQERSAAAQTGKTVRYFSKRLLDALRPMLTNPLTLVEAPAGFGKSVAVKYFLEKAKVTVLVTIASQSSPESFWPDFCDKLAQNIADAEDASAALKKLGLPRDFTQTRAALDLLRRIPFPSDTFLVFDDCHNLPRFFLDFCESLAALKDAVPGVRVVCVARDGWASDRIVPRPEGSPSRIDRRAFTLTPLEIREYYARHGIALSPGQERELHEKTDGWIAALYLSLAWYQEHGEFSSFPPDTVIRIRETVYASLSAEVRDLLFSLTPLEGFTAVQASRLHKSDATALLGELTGKNAFVAYDRQSKAYSLHAIFRQFLLALFHDDAILPPERRRRIYRACGEMLKDAGDLASAMEAWHKAGEFERALAVLESDMSRNMVTERAGLYVAMFKDCPEEILERHIGASFKYAIAAFSAGDFQAFGTRLAWLAQRCAALPPGSEGDRWRGELHVLLALTEFNDIEAMSRHHRLALTLLKGETTRLYAPTSPWTLGCPSVLFMFHRESGRLRDELRHMRECMPYYYLLTENHGEGAEFLMEAESLYNAGEFGQAAQTCTTALDRAELRGQLDNEFCALFLQMRLALLAGDAKALFGDGKNLGLMPAMRGLIAERRDFYLLHTADVCEGWLYAALSLYDNIPEWLCEPLGGDSPLYAFAKGYYYLVHGRARLLELQGAAAPRTPQAAPAQSAGSILAGEYAALIEQVNALLHTGVFANNLLFSVYAHIYLAAALHKTNRRNEAASALKTALDAALPDALYIPFAENYDLIGPVLTKALSGKEYMETLSRIEALAKRMQAGCEAVLREIAAPKLSALLSERELEVALLVGKGLSNNEIAKILHITDHTVKAHLRSVYRKSGAQNRSGLRKISRQIGIAKLALPY